MYQLKERSQEIAEKIREILDDEIQLHLEDIAGDVYGEQGRCITDDDQDEIYHELYDKVLDRLNNSYVID